MKTVSFPLTLSFALVAIFFAGCFNNESPNLESVAAPTKMDTHASHDHPTEGPHQGDLIELGNEEYHAEIIHDEDTGTVTIYILNGSATEQVPIDTPEVAINAKREGNPEQFKLAASPDTGDPQDQSSRFVSTDKKLAQALDEEGGDPRLVLTINGKSYRGTISHNHAHGGHDH